MSDPMVLEALRPRPQRLGYSLTVAYAVLLLLLFFDTTASMVLTWQRSETFTHGYLILPISLWLIWQKKAWLQQLAPCPTLSYALLLVPLGVAWLLGNILTINLLQQLALIAMLVVGIAALVGREVMEEIWFPLLFLFLAVPMGAGLIPAMMDFTASSTVWLIQQTGIPVYREGLYFMLPSGNWSVVEACSGVRYLIASFTLGVLFAYLTFRSIWRRLAFVAASVVVPIIANTLRAFMIVMLGHFSDMKIATGVDHLIYGWVFFGVVVLLLFWVGSLFSDEVPRAVEPDLAVLQQTRKPPYAWYGTVVFVLMLSVWPLYARVAFDNVGQRAALVSVPSTPPAVDGWASVAPISSDWWQAGGGLGHWSAGYERGDQPQVTAVLQFADYDRQRTEVVGNLERFAAGDDWRLIDRSGVLLDKANGDDAAVLARIQRPGGSMLVLSWYQVGGVIADTAIEAKLQELRVFAGMAPAGSYRIVLATAIAQDEATAQRRLLSFAQVWQPVLSRMLPTAMITGH